jgi:hypothetical protein
MAGHTLTVAAALCLSAGAAQVTASVNAEGRVTGAQERRQRRGDGAWPILVRPPA